MVMSCILVVVTEVVMSQQTNIHKGNAHKFWWLGPYTGRKSPFGGRNYNIEEVTRGEHIRTDKNKQIAQREVKQVSKRQTGEFEFGDEDSEFLEERLRTGNPYLLKEVLTQCPLGSRCVETFFCQELTGRTIEDRIPCLINSGDFAGDFAFCCKKSFGKVCPRVPVVPPARDCVLLGDPEAEECDRRGVRSNCKNPSDLCCFNGCINVCLEDPPYTVENGFFDRKEGKIISRKPIPGDNPSQRDEQDSEDSEFSSGESFSSDENLSTDIDSVSPKLRTRLLGSDGQLSPRASRVLMKLIRRLQDKVS